MAYKRITAEEAAALINDGDYIGLGGFTPNGNPKAVFRCLSKRAIREHAEGKPFQVGILTGASSCQSIEGDMANAHAIKFRAPFSTNKALPKDFSCSFSSLFLNFITYRGLGY